MPKAPSTDSGILRFFLEFSDVHFNLISRKPVSRKIDHLVSLVARQWLIGDFCPKIFDKCWGPMKAFCRSVNVHGVVVLFSGGGDT